MKNAVIHLVSVAGDPPERTELSTEGTVQVRDGKYLLCYDEGELLGEEKTRTTLQIVSPERVVILRTGATRSRLVVEKGKTVSCRYGTPYGELTLEIVGEEVTAECTETGGKLHLAYRIDTAGKPLSHTDVKITFREVLE